MFRGTYQMRKVREVLRLNHSGLSVRAIARACSIGRESVREYLCRASEAGLSWPLPEELDDKALEQQLFPSVIKIYGKRSCPNWTLIHEELRRKGVTRRLLWTDLKSNHMGKPPHLIGNIARFIITEPLDESSGLHPKN